MAGRPNHRGWVVLDSIRSLDGLWCVDLIEHPAGGFGFEHFRAEPEDRGQWTAVGGHGATVFDSPIAALEAAVAGVGWLDADRGDVVAARERLVVD